MPNPKLGSVTSDVSGAVKEAKCGRIDFKIDKTAIVHAGLGKEKINFLKNKLSGCVGTLFFRSGYIMQVVMSEIKPEEVLLGRFQRGVSKTGIIQGGADLCL